MQSCDTFALKGSCYEFGKNLLAKNSDRPLGECQPLVLIPGQDHPVGTTVKCTDLTIPQAARTYTVLGSRPYWIWGFEMGLNEWGLAIGNEAQGSRCKAETETGLLGMDLLRLGLERAKTCREAITVITELLEQYGQNANASPLFDRRYENSFLLVDPTEIWLLETAGRQWAAKQIPDRYAISNCYTIGTEYDLASKDVEIYARDRRWLAPSEPFAFAKAYTMPAVRQSGSVPRWRRLNQLIEAAGEVMTLDQVLRVLRDHFEGELIEPRNGGCYGGFISICMHAMTWDACQTAASLLACWQEGLGWICRWAPAIPCCSAYLPLYFTGKLPESMTCGGEKFSSNSIWWTVERLGEAVSIDEARFGPVVRDALRELELALEQEARQTEQQVASLMAQGQLEQANALLNALMGSAADRLMTLANTLFADIHAEVEADGGLYGIRKEFLEDYCRRVELPL